MMEGAGLGNRLVRDNLRELDAALATLPTARARELREQITAHLDEALQPGADDQSFAATLGRLGAPADLAADAGEVAGRRTWIRLAAAVVVTGIEAGDCSSVVGDLNDRDRAAVGIQRDGLPTCVALSLDRPDRHASRFERRGRRFDIRHRYGHDAVAGVVRIAHDIQPAAIRHLPHHFILFRDYVCGPGKEAFVPGLGCLEVADRDTSEENIGVHHLSLAALAT